MNKNIVLLLILTLVALSCDKKSDQITDKSDYEMYLKSNKNLNLKYTQTELIFWEKKLKKAPNQTSYLYQIASHNTTLFNISANLKYLYEAENSLKRLNSEYKNTEVSGLRALAKNYITQHRFKEAELLALMALKIGESKKESEKILFDASMELGKYKEAKLYLNNFTDLNDFDALIRLAKWNDHLGDLKTAINFMEKATDIVEKNKTNALNSWVYTNLADMYGHAGDCKKSYEYYLKTLHHEPENTYALKGIAWIVFSKEKNTTEAKRIISSIVKKHNSPDFELFQSEIAEYEKNTSTQKTHLKNYFNFLENNKYGDMYNKYNVLLLSEDKSTLEKALKIAEREVQNRPTPDSYDLLAWCYLQKGNTKKALDIAQNHVANKSFEPELTFHLASIYKANGMKEEVSKLKKELQESLYELGPNMESKINAL